MERYRSPPKWKAFSKSSRSAKLNVRRTCASLILVHRVLSSAKDLNGETLKLNASPLSVLGSVKNQKTAADPFAFYNVNNQRAWPLLLQQKHQLQL
jgi:hypothetical protein